MNKNILTKILFCLSYTAINAFSSNHLSHVFSDTALTNQAKNFLDNVLRQIDSQKVLDIINTIDKNNSDKDFYKLMLEKITEIKSKTILYKQIKALRYQKSVIASQIHKLIDNMSCVNNCVEIGNPGTYLHACSNFLKITGSVYAINEKQNLTDLVQAFKFRPTKKFVGYDKFVSLDNYKEISEESISSNSIDLLICTIGLHHIPQTELTGFINSIKRVLKPGGIFILREHDCKTDDLKSLAYVAHSLYNAIATNESVDSEINEYRNFQPLQYWIDLLTDNGFVAGPERFLQEGDPTLNTLLKFTKKAASCEEKVLEFSEQLKKSDSVYERDLIRTYLTSTEWYNVDIAQEYAEFINHTPFYEFPYFESIKTYWKIFLNSWKSAAKKKGHMNILMSETTLMNLFIGTTMTIEYAAKGVVSAPVRLLCKGEEPRFIKAIIYDPKDQISDLCSNIRTISTDTESKIKIIEIPRYKEFLNILLKIAETSSKTGIDIKEIAGQKEIQFKVKTIHNSPEFDSIEGCHKEYSWKSVSCANNIITALTVQLRNLSTVINKLKDENVEILYIHDF